jgi:hypothetical protein
LYGLHLIITTQKCNNFVKTVDDSDEFFWIILNIYCSWTFDKNFGGSCSFHQIPSLQKLGIWWNNLYRMSDCGPMDLFKFDGIWGTERAGLVENLHSH